MNAETIERLMEGKSLKSEPSVEGSFCCRPAVLRTLVCIALLVPFVVSALLLYFKHIDILIWEVPLEHWCYFFASVICSYFFADFLMGVVLTVMDKLFSFHCLSLLGFSFPCRVLSCSS
jgi:hypothetical protein